MTEPAKEPVSRSWYTAIIWSRRKLLGLTVVAVVTANILVWCTRNGFLTRRHRFKCSGPFARGGKYLFNAPTENACLDLESLSLSKERMPGDAELKLLLRYAWTSANDTHKHASIDVYLYNSEQVLLGKSTEIVRHLDHDIPTKKEIPGSTLSYANWDGVAMYFDHVQVPDIDTIEVLVRAER